MKTPPRTEDRGSRGWVIYNDDGTTTPGVFRDGEVLPANVTIPTEVDESTTTLDEPTTKPRKRKE